MDFEQKTMVASIRSVAESCRGVWKPIDSRLLWQRGQRAAGRRPWAGREMRRTLSRHGARKLVADRHLDVDVVLWWWVGCERLSLRFAGGDAGVSRRVLGRGSAGRVLRTVLFVVCEQECE